MPHNPNQSIIFHTGNPRGYFVLRKRSHLEKPTLLFKTVSPEDSPTFHNGWLKIFNTALMPWHNWMKSSEVSNFTNGATAEEAIRKLLLLMMSSNCTGNNRSIVMPKYIDVISMIF